MTMAFCLFQTSYIYNVSYDNMKVVVSTVTPSYIPVQNIKRLTLSESYKVLLDPHNQKQLFPEGYFGLPCLWFPCAANDRNLRAAACRNDVTASFSPDGTTCESVVFHSLIVNGDVTRFDVWVYGTQVSAHTVLSHILFWLKIKFNVLSTKLVSFVFCFPRDVDKQEVNSHLVGILGLPEEGDVFDTDECVMLLRIFLRNKQELWTCDKQ